jgi:phospho-N-acetylmuramoyl-pentapeptide-transferase
MFYNLLTPFADVFGPLNIFRYLTFRTGGAIMTALLISFIIAPAMIRRLKALQGAGQPIRDDGPATHFKKRGTPTMGGLMMLIAISIATLLWVDLTNIYAWIVLFVTLGFGTLGFTDDVLKLTKRNPIGISGRLKLTAQLAISLVAVVAVQLVMPAPLNTGLALPILNGVLIPLGMLFLPFAILVMIGASNAVNLTDGLDGLAIVPVMIAASCFGLISYLVGHAVFANYLGIHPVRGTGELAIVCGAIVGAGLGFLWFNAPPAMVFMGDTGSLSLGGALGTIAVITKHELVLAIIGGLFVLETVSVIVQVISFKLTGKRVFAMAPLHHHFEKKGWAEPTIVIRFWIIAVVLALIGLSTLKLR